MTFAEKMKAKAIAAAKVLVLPEGTEERTLQAARKILDGKIAKKVILLGKIDEITAKAKELGVDLAGLECVDPETSDLRKEYGHEYYELRKKKGMSEEEAYEKINDVLRFGAMMVRMGAADTMVAGAENTTGKVLVACFTIIKCKPGIKSASSCFVMSTKMTDLGIDGAFIFADGSTIPDPTAEQLSEIAAASAQSCKTFLGAEPKVAMLSYSTMGSAKGPAVEKVQQAVELVHQNHPEIACDGEMQLDAAIIESVAAQKAPGSAVAGHANTLIFPELQSANIGYKLVQRLGGAVAIGPILQGFNKPVSDLSRGCSVEDIVLTSAITLAQAAAEN